MVSGWTVYDLSQQCECELMFSALKTYWRSVLGGVMVCCGHQWICYLFLLLGTWELQKCILLVVAICSILEIHNLLENF